MSLGRRLRAKVPAELSNALTRRDHRLDFPLMACSPARAGAPTPMMRG